MDRRLEHAEDRIMQAVETVTSSELTTTEAVCNLEKLVKSAHYIAEIRMLEAVSPEDYARGYGRGYNADHGNGTHNTLRGGDGGYRNSGNEVRMYLEESLRNAKSEAERERIRRMMNEY